MLDMNDYRRRKVNNLHQISHGFESNLLSRNSSERLIFISYGNGDQNIAKYFSSFLERLISPADGIKIYCTALNDNAHGTLFGKELDFIEMVRNAKFFIPLISSNYLSSPSALQELGGASCLNLNIFALLTPNSDYTCMEKLYSIRNKCSGNIADKEDLKKFLNKFCKELGVIPENYETAVQEFYRLFVEKNSSTSNVKHNCFLIRDKNRFLDEDKFKLFIELLSSKNLLEICSFTKKDNKILSCMISIHQEKTIDQIDQLLRENDLDCKLEPFYY